MYAQQLKKCVGALLKSIFSVIWSKKNWPNRQKNLAPCRSLAAAKQTLNHAVRHKSLICAAENPVLQGFSANNCPLGSY